MSLYICKIYIVNRITYRYPKPHLKIILGRDAPHTYQENKKLDLSNSFSVALDKILFLVYLLSDDYFSSKIQ